VWEGEYDLTIITNNMIFVYHRICGGLMMKHRLSDESFLVEAIPPCTCYRAAPSPVTDEQTTSQVLEDVYVRLQTCETVGDVRRMVEEVASREQMREQSL
jgi:hypothetical protein